MYEWGETAAARRLQTLEEQHLALLCEAHEVGALLGEEQAAHRMARDDLLRKETPYDTFPGLELPCYTPIDFSLLTTLP